MTKLVVIPGDGIGHEVVPAAVEVLQAAIPDLQVEHAEAGWACFEERGVSVPDETLAAIRDAGAALFGAVASPAHKVEGYRSAIVTMRQELELHANVRPIRSWPIGGTRQGIDMLVVRENTEGLYVGRERQEEGRVIAERVVTRQASERIARAAFELARQGWWRRVTIVHKANILPLSDGLFRDTVRQVASEYSEIEVDELLADTAALWLVRDPDRFDVIVTTNLFGDILSDAAVGWTGPGLAPSLNLGDGVALAEPVHGAAPDIAGQGIANPIAAILSGALLARHVWHMPAAGEAMEKAVEATLRAGLRTPDIAGSIDDTTDTAGMAQAIIANLQRGG
ncbi:MAG: isocitrate/isopropylmalate dehydrogenase family protein [Anaerolineae bacterium]